MNRTYSRSEWDDLELYRDLELHVIPAPRPVPRQTRGRRLVLLVALVTFVWIVASEAG